MDIESIEWLVRKTIAARLRIDVDAIQATTNFQDLNMDSLDLAELFFLLEDQIKRSIHLESTSELLTVKDVVILIQGAAVD